MAEYDLYRARNEDYFRQGYSGPGIWRYRGLLPIYPDQRTYYTQGEGFTPVYNLEKLADEMPLQKVLLKNEAQNPGGSIKDREMSVALSALTRLKDRGIFIESSGTSAVAASRYSALAGRKCFALMPRGVPMQFVGECQTHGAMVKLSDWHPTTRQKVKEEVQKRTQLVNLNTEGLTFRIEGAKTLYYELMDQLQGDMPNVIIVPVGEGTTLAGIWKAILELVRLGKLQKKDIPRIYGVQSDSCPSLDAVLRKYELEYSTTLDTIAPDLYFPEPVLGELLVRIITEFKWEIVLINDEEILSTWKHIAQLEGFLLSPEGAATIVALDKLVKQGKVDASDRVLVLNPSNGSRYIQSIGFLKEDKN
ncbi:MAG: pyridoxal-phosphate dependent enzyme [Calditrichaeota bacterium]|nr:pyridoxal-phosphate dependent enzyme [Calditrichota bacterium]